VESLLEIAESPERLSLSGGGSGGYPQIRFHPLLLQEKGARGMRLSAFLYFMVLMETPA
jgi:hypothetical protein